MTRPSDARFRGVLGAVVGYFAARRALLPSLATVGYVLGSHVGSAGPDGAARAWLTGALALGCAYVAASPTLPGNGLRDDGQRRVGLLAYALWALAVVLASLTRDGSSLSTDLCGDAGALVSGVTAARALVRTRGGQGIERSLPRPLSSHLAFTILLILGAFGLAMFADGSAGEAWQRRDGEAVAAASALMVLSGSTYELLRRKRLVLGAGDRLLTALGVIVVVTTIAAGSVALGVGSPAHVLRLAVAIAAIVVTYVCTEGDAERLARLGRRAVALVLFGGPFVMLGGLAAEGPGRSTTALLVTGAVALVIGSAAPLLELPLRRADGHLLDSLESARQALLRADPESSVTDALSALRTFSGTSTESPELWSRAPERVTTVDSAGYRHERAAALPALLLELGRDEPEATVRAELLDALLVRRPDLRPLARWMGERGALSATLILRGGDIEGVLVLPRGARSVPLSLEEVRAMKQLADAFAGAAAAHAALERSLERERAATVRADAVSADMVARERVFEMGSARDGLVTARLAETAAGGPYAPAARFAVDEITRGMEQGVAVVVAAPNGSDVTSYLARTHLAGRRRDAPFVVVDGASPREHVVGRWRDPLESPLALADRGVLVLCDGARLPREVQRIVADAVSHRVGPWSEAPLDVALALTRPHDLEEGAFDPVMATLLGEAGRRPIVWPHLRERGEDLRALLLAGLARDGLSLRGAPLGIDDAAYAELADYAFPGEDVELRSIVHRLALLARGDVVRARDVAELGLARGDVSSVKEVARVASGGRDEG